MTDPRITYQLYLDCGLSVTETVRQSGLSASTVRRHIAKVVRPTRSREDTDRSRRVDDLLAKLEPTGQQLAAALSDLNPAVDRIVSRWQD